MDKLILASQSEVRQKILKDNNILCEAIPSKLDEEPVKKDLIMNKINPEKIAQKLASLKSKKISDKFINRLVLTISSSTFEGLTILTMLCLSKISFRTLLFDAKIIFLSISFS